MQRKKRVNIFRRGLSTPKIIEKIPAGIFGYVSWGRAGGQPGTPVEAGKGTLSTLLKRSSTPTYEGYGAVYPDQPTRIIYLGISREIPSGRKIKQDFGTYDIHQVFPRAKHKFENQAKRDKELKYFLADILKYFNGI